MLARAYPLRGRSRQAGVLAGPRDEPAYLRVALALQVPFENDRRGAGPDARRLQVGFGRERPFRCPIAWHGSETQRLVQRPPLQRQHAPRCLLVVRCHFLERLAEPLHFVERGATRRDQRETKDVPVRMGKAGKCQRRNREMRLPSRCAARRVPRHDLGYGSSHSRLPIATHQRVAQHAADEGRRPDIGNRAFDHLQGQPVVLQWHRIGFFGEDRSTGANRRTHGICAVGYLQLAQASRIDAPVRGPSGAEMNWGIGRQKPAPDQASRMTDVAYAARDPIQCVEQRGFGFRGPGDSHDRVVRAGDWKAARLTWAAVRHDSHVRLRRPRCAWIVRWHEDVWRCPSGMFARVNGRRWLGLQPLQRLPLFRPFAACSPSGDQGGEHSVRLRRPVRIVVAGLAGGPANAGQELDLKNEAHRPRSLHPRPATLVHGCGGRSPPACPAA